MRIGRMALLLGVTAMVALPTGTLAQTTSEPRTANAAPDLSGYWFQGNLGRFSTEPPLQPWAAEIRRRNRLGLENPEDQGLDGLDPSTFCFPPGAPRLMTLRQFQIVQTPKEAILLFEWDSSVRHIYLDGRGHPDGWPFGWMGHSVGKYEGVALVADTTGFNDKTWLDFTGTPHSDALRMIERFRRLAPDRLEIEFRFEDPKAFTRAWEVTKVYRPAPEVLEHVPCEDFLQMGKYREAYWPAAQ